MDALFLSQREIKPLTGYEPKDEGHGIQWDSDGYWYHTKYGHRAWTGTMEKTDTLLRMEQIARKCDMLVVQLGTDGIENLLRFLGLDLETRWREKKITFVTCDQSLKTRSKLLNAFFPKADCIMSAGETSNEMDEYMTSFLLVSSSPREFLDHRIVMTRRLLDPFGLHTRP